MVSGQHSMNHEAVLVLDFGSQYTQLIARRIREAGVYSEILPFNVSPIEIKKRQPKGLILSGGPESVFSENSPHPDPEIYNFEGPLLGICYGMQLLARHFGGNVTPSHKHEYGRAPLQQKGSSALFEGLPHEIQVWMSHGDRIEEVPAEFRAIAHSSSALGAIEHGERPIYGLQFHPEVVHTPLGKEILENFIFRICHCRGDWTMASFIEASVGEISEQIGENQAVCGLSGGVDSTVAASLVHQAIGNRLNLYFCR